MVPYRKIVALAVLLSVLLTLQVAGAPKKKEYPLFWPSEKGTVIIWLTTNTMERERFYLDKELKVLDRVGDKYKVNYDYLANWQVVDVMDGDKLLMMFVCRNGKITVHLGDKKHVLEIENPEHADRLENPVFAPYLREVKNGYAFLLQYKGSNKGRVHATWTLKEVKIESGEKGGSVGQYEKELVQGNKDPFLMEASYKQIPNAYVAEGYEWELEGTQGSYKYKRQFKFKDVKKHRGDNVAEIISEGTYYNQAGEQVGTLKTECLFNYKYGAIMYFKIEYVLENKVPLTQSKREGVGGVLEKMTYTSEMQLYKTNANETEEWKQWKDK